MRGHRLLIVLVTLAAIGASVAWVALRTPEYKATADLLVNPLPQEDQTFLNLPLLRDSGDPTRTIQTAATVVESGQAAQRTARALGRGWTPREVLKAVDVEPQGESNILAVTAKADDAGVATRLANAFARGAIESRGETAKTQARFQIDRLEARRRAVPDASPEAADLTDRINQLAAVRNSGDPTLSLSQPAARPESPTGLPDVVVFLLAGIAGFTLGSGAALLLELTERRIRDEDEAVGLYPLPVLARVAVLSRRQLRRRTAGRWVMPPPVREAFRTLLVQLGESEGSRVVMVTSASTGDGKTSSAVNLGAAIAAAGERAIILDFDLRKPDVGRTLGIEGAAPPLASLVREGAALDDLLASAPAIPGLSVLSAKVAEGDVALVEALNRRLPELMAEARAIADYVVIDTAPLGEISDALRIVQHVEDILIVTRPGHTNRENYEVMRDLLERTGVAPKGLLVIGHVAPTSSAYYGYGFSGREGHERRGPLARVRPR